MIPAPVVRQLDAARARLQVQAEPSFREGVQRYFQHSIDAYGVRTPAVRRLAGSIYREVRDWPLAERNRLCTELWRSGKFEEGSLAVYLYQRFHRQCGSCEFHLFEKWIDRFVGNWAHCDGVGTMLISETLIHEPSLIALLPPWTNSPNRWKRRAAAVSLIWEGRKGRHTEEILGLARALLGDSDDMVQKGVGWLLKDAYPARPQEVTNFLKLHGAGTSRLVLRIAAEKMTARHRAQVLGSAR